MKTRWIQPAIGIVLLGLAIALPYIAPSYWVSLATLTLASAILASSINMLAGDGDLVSLGHAGIAAAAAYGVGWSVKQGYGTLMQLAIALAVTVVISAVYALSAMRTKGIYFLMVTLALGMVVFGLAYRLAPITGGENGLSGLNRPEPIAPYWMYYFAVLGIFLVVTAILWVMSRSPMGNVLRGIRDSDTRMLSLGYSIVKYKVVAILASGMIAGLAGVLLMWHTQFVSPTSAGFHRSAFAVVMVILGGVGRTWGPLIGAAIVVWFEQVLSIGIERWPTLLGLAFIVVVMFAPGGVLGAIERLRGIRRPPDQIHPLEAEPVATPTSSSTSN